MYSLNYYPLIIKMEKIMPPVNGFSPIQLSVILNAHRSADSDGDNMTTKRELEKYRDVATDKSELAALDVLIDNYSLFASNRGLPKGSMQTMEVRPDDDKISYDEILAVSGFDGDASTLSEKDVENPWAKYLPK